MVQQLQHRTRGRAAAKAARHAGALDGETVILRKMSGGYVLEATSPDRSGMRVPGYFIPASPNDSKHMQRTLTEIISRARHRGADSVSAALSKAELRVPVQPSAPIHVPDPAPAEDYRDREARRWKEIRESFLREHRSVNAPQLAELTGSQSINPSSRAHEWLRAGKIFAVHDGNVTRYPLFQIDEKEGRPRPEVREAVAHLREQLSDWQIAVWFTTENAWTGEWRR